MCLSLCPCTTLALSYFELNDIYTSTTLALSYFELNDIYTVIELAVAVWLPLLQLGLRSSAETRTAILYAEPLLYGTGADDRPQLIGVGVCDVTGTLTHTYMF